MESLLVVHITIHAPPSVRGGPLENNAPPIRPKGWRIIFQCATPKNLIGGAFPKCATPKSLGVAHFVDARPIRLLGGGAFWRCTTHKSLVVAHFNNAPPLTCYMRH